MGQLTDLADRAFACAIAKGWWEQSTLASQIALVHSEVSEVFMEHRAREARPSTRLPGFLQIEEEAADVVLALLNLAGRERWRIEKAVLAKLRHNEQKPAVTKTDRRF